MTILRLSYAELGARLGRSEPVAAGGSASPATMAAWSCWWTRPNGPRTVHPNVLVNVRPNRPNSVRPSWPPRSGSWQRRASEIARLEGEATGHADRVQDLHNALADLAGRLDRATAELTEARRSWLERVLAALRR